MRIDGIVQQREKERISDGHVTRNDDGNRQACRHANRIPRHDTTRRAECHDSDQWQENCRRQAPIIRDAALCKHDYRRTTQCHRPHESDPPQHVREHRQPEAPRRAAGKRDLRYEREVCDCGRALIRDFFDLVEGFGFYVAWEGEEASYSEQCEGGKEHEVEDKHDRRDYTQAVELPWQNVHDD